MPKLTKGQKKQKLKFEKALADLGRAESALQLASLRMGNAVNDMPSIRGRLLTLRQKAKSLHGTMEISIYRLGEVAEELDGLVDKKFPDE